MVISPKLVLSFSLLGEKEKKKNWRFHQLNDQMNHANNIPCQTGRNLQRNPSEVSVWRERNPFEVLTSEGFILVFKDQNLGFS